MGSFQKRKCLSFIVLETDKSKIFSFLLHDFHTSQLQKVAIPAIVFSPNKIKILATCQICYLLGQWFFLIFFFFLLLLLLRQVETVGQLIVTIINNITKLVPHNNICFGYFILWAKVSIRTFVQLSPPTPSLCQVLNRFVCCFRRYTLLRKITQFRSKTIFFIQLCAGLFWFCCFVYTCFLAYFSKFCHLETSNSLILAFMHSFLFDLSSNHAGKQTSPLP